MLRMLLMLLGLLTVPLTGSSMIDAAHEPDTSDELAILQSYMLDSIPSESEEISTLVWEELHSMGDVALYHDLKDVIANKGEPISIEKDVYTGYIEYRYEDINVGFYKNVVYYVHAGNCPEQVKINGKWLVLRQPDIMQVLGKPDYVADDGEVYIRNLAALKIYKNPVTGSITAVDLFDTIAF